MVSPYSIALHLMAAAISVSPPISHPYKRSYPASPKPKAISKARAKVLKKRAIDKANRRKA